MKKFLYYCLCIFPIFILSGCFVAAPTDTTDSDQADSKNYIYQCDIYDLNGDGRNDYFGLYLDLDKENREVEFFEAIVSNDYYSRSTGGFSEYDERYEIVDVACGDFDGDGADEIACLRLFSDRAKYAISIYKFDEQNVFSPNFLEFPGEGLVGAGYAYSIDHLHDNTIFIRFDPFDSRLNTLREFPSSFVGYFADTSNKNIIDHHPWGMTTIPYQEQDALLFSQPLYLDGVFIGDMWEAVCWQIYYIPISVEAWFQPAGMERDAYRGYNLQHSGWPHKLGYGLHGNNDHLYADLDTNTEWITAHNRNAGWNSTIFSGSISLSSVPDVGISKIQVMDANSNVLLNETWDATVLMDSIAADVMGDNAREVVFLGKTGTGETRLGILDISSRQFYTISNEYIANVTEMQIHFFDSRYYIALYNSISQSWRNYAVDYDQHQNNLNLEILK